MIRYAGKPTKDEDGNITGWSKLRPAGNREPLPHGYDSIYGAERWDHFRASFVDDQWIVEEDENARDDRASHKSEKAAAGANLEAAMSTFESDLNKATTIAAVKAVIKPIIRDLLIHKYK